jgi:hypothetical protein
VGSVVSDAPGGSQARHAPDWSLVLAPLGVVVYLVSSAFHGGEQADDLPAVLPQYAANQLWLVSHAGQLLGMLLLLAGWATSLTWLSKRPSTVTRARVVLLLAAAVYTINQAVDGVAVQHVAQVYVGSPAQQQPTALLVADAVRHVEIGLTGAFQALLGVALLLTAVAVAGGQRWFAGLSAVVAAGWLVLAADVARNGFANTGPTSVAALGLVVWVVGLLVLGRSAGQRSSTLEGDSSMQ